MCSHFANLYSTMNLFRVSNLEGLNVITVSLDCGKLDGKSAAHFSAAITAATTTKESSYERRPSISTVNK